MKKNIIILNLIVLLIMFFLFDYFVFKNQMKEYGLNMKYFDNMTKKIAISSEYDRERINDFFKLRKPLNENSSKDSIVLTGCSFIYGSGLNDEETLSYKISELINRPVYNLGIPTTSLNHTIYLLKSGIFEEKVRKNPEIIIYNYADFHLQRIVMPNMPYEPNEYLYIIKNNELQRKKPPFIISRFPLLSLIRENLYGYAYNNIGFYRNYLKKLLKYHFIEMKKEIDNKYKNVKFVILIYYDSPLFEEIAQDLEKDGFIIVRIKEDLQLDCSEQKYMQPDGHPTSEVWEIIAPKLVDKIF